VPVFGAKEKADVVRMLEKVPIFSPLSERQLGRLARDSLDKSFPEGTSIVKQGEKGIAFFLLLEGRADVRRNGRRLATLNPGDFFGEMALLDEEPRSADVVATQPTRCLVLSKWEFWGFALNEPRMLRGMLEEMARRLSRTNRSLSE
jgi:CRP/FNR family transcriptional regulator, cyclic AMP receptor protein